MSEVVSPKSQEEYEDDFEKDLDWLISEEGRSEEQGSDIGDIDAEIDKELEKDEKPEEEKRNESMSQKPDHAEEDEERWPSPMEPLEYDIDQESPSKSLTVVASVPEIDEQTDEEDNYILEKIQQANKELQEQESPDTTRQRRLQFKVTLVDLVVPPLDFPADSNTTEIDGESSSKDRTKVADADIDVTEKMSELNISPHNETKGFIVSSSDELKETKESKVLVEKDGKFDLVCMKDMETQSVLPPIVNNLGNSTKSSPRIHQQARKTHSSFSSPQLRIGSSSYHLGIDQLRVPRPPTKPRVRPNSASHSQNVIQGKNSKRRVQSAAGTPSQSTYTLSPQQKELLQKIQEKKERLAREAEQRKLEEEKLKREENEQAFKAWLMKKRELFYEDRRIQRAQGIERMNTRAEQRNLEEEKLKREENEQAFKAWLMKKRELFHEDRRIQHAQEIERMNTRRDSYDPKEAFRLWLRRKQEQHQKERQLVELKKLEEDSSYLLHSRVDCERAFKLWLKRKREEKRAEEQAIREQSRRLVLEERHARRMRDLMCAVNETKPFWFTVPAGYHF